MTLATVATITQTAPPPLHLILRALPPSLEQPVGEVLRSLRACALLSLEERRAVARWEGETAGYWETGDDRARDRAALALCFLLIDTVRPALLRARDEAHQEQLLGLEDTLLSLVESLLPDGGKAEDFVQEVEEFDRERRLSVAKLAAMKGCFQRQTEQLYKVANTHNETLQQQFEALKRRLLELNGRRKEMAAEIQERLDGVAKQVERVAALLATHAETAHALGGKLEEEELQMQKLIQECQQALHKV